MLLFFDRCLSHDYKKFIQIINKYHFDKMEIIINNIIYYSLYRDYNKKEIIKVMEE